MHAKQQNLLKPTYKSTDDYSEPPNLTAQGNFLSESDTISTKRLVRGII